MGKTNFQDTTYRDQHNFFRIWQRKYYAMRQRTEGKGAHDHASKGKPICEQAEFLEWCLDPIHLLEFVAIFNAWRASGYKYELCPTIDRIDNDGGYTLDNIQWLSFSNNMAKVKGYLDGNSEM